MVLSIKESREFTLFRAFAENKTFKEALEAIKTHDEAHPEGRILASSDDKLFLHESYKAFREAEKPLMKNGERPDYGNPQLLERLKTILSQQLPAVSRVVISDKMTGASMTMANIGRMLAVHAKNVKALGRKELARQKLAAAQEEKRQAALIEKQGRVNVGGYGGNTVFSVKSGEYMTSGQAIRQRMIEERT